jgi:diacylglycerol kinase family enzyme
MTILVNPGAGGGTGLKKWRAIAERIRERTGPFVEVITSDLRGMEAAVDAALNSGESHFVAAGGDGTVNSLANHLLLRVQSPSAAGIILGAIGLGSSNDLHKPLKGQAMIDGSPTMLDFSAARPRDVGVVTFEHHDDRWSRVFLINASAGVTAEANLFFNQPDPALGWLKRRSTPLAITYAALRTILLFKNRTVEVSSAETGRFTSSLTNIGIIKNPHFSGDLRYPGEAEYGSGQFSVYLFDGLRRSGLLHLMMALSKGKLPGALRARSWSSQRLEISSDLPIVIESDGEVVRTHSVAFHILPRHLKVCP